MKFTYLAINFFTIIVPFGGSFDRRLHFYTRWKYCMPGLLFTAIFFLVWDYFKTRYGVWSFNEKYIIGVKFFGLPFEEVLFFFTVPYACTFIYECLYVYQKKRIFPNNSSYIVMLLSLVMVASSFIFTHRAYTFSVLFLLGTILPLSLQVLDAEELDRFIQMYLVSLIPMFVVDGLLTALPVVMYDNTQNLGLRIGTIPVEDFLYSAILLLMNVALYEWNVKRHINNKSFQ
jgi:lycopene cyclase domain-containing protein